MDGRNAADTFTSMLHAIDAKDWNGVRLAFADRVDVDYSSLFGEPAATVAADDLVAGWRAFASVFDATQHVTGPIVVTSDPFEAAAHTHVRAYHQVRGAPGGEVWMVAGHYTARLLSIGDTWKIGGITLSVFYQDGNMAIPDLARARAASNPPVHLG
jgi:SnoaL-like domain